MRVELSRKAKGFTLVELMIVVAIIGLLGSIALPNFVRARQVSQADTCINNLRQIDGAIQRWALENNMGPDSVVAPANIQPYLGRGGVLVNTAGGQVAGQINCPADGTYSIVDVKTAPKCTVLGPPPHCLAF